MKNFIILLLFLLVAFSLPAANAERPPDEVTIDTPDLVVYFIGFPSPEKTTEPKGITAKFRALQMKLILWKEQLRANKHENLSHNAAKSLGFNRNKEVNYWDFKSDCNSKYNANKLLFETPDFMWSDSKIAVK